MSLMSLKEDLAILAVWAKMTLNGNVSTFSENPKNVYPPEQKPKISLWCILNWWTVWWNIKTHLGLSPKSPRVMF